MHTIRLFCILVVLLLPFSLSAVEKKPTRKRPNVIIIYSDDQGAVDLGCYGTKDILTPQIDRLAKTGTRFTRMYAPAAVCSASRAGLLTGKIPARAGVPGNVSSSPGVPGLPASETTIAKIFQAAGYKTGHFGKWHLGFTPETMPLGHGFDESYGHMGGCIDNYSHYFYWQGPNRHDLYRDGKEIFEPGRYYPERITDECIDFVRRHREEPFFIYLAYNIPHYPYQPTQEWMKRYENIEPYPVTIAGTQPHHRVSAMSSAAIRTLYAAFVSGMDEQIGRVLDAVEQCGLRDDTMILFQADQGHSFEERAFRGGGHAGRFRGGKFSLFDGGLRVPSVFSWPGQVPEDTVCDTLAYACDWLPTLADFCGVTLPDADIDGKNLRLVICENAPTPHEKLFWQNGNSWAVLAGDWKLHGNPIDPSQNGPMPEKDAKRLLINMRDDPEERRNLAETHPGKVEELERMQREFLRSIQSDRRKALPSQ